MIVKCSKCETDFRSKPAPCPDNKEGCAVAHFDGQSFICTSCGYNNGPDVAECFKEGRVEFLEGISIINAKAIQKLELK